MKIGLVSHDDVIRGKKVTMTFCFSFMDYYKTHYEELRGIRFDEKQPLLVSNAKKLPKGQPFIFSVTTLELVCSFVV